MNIQKRGQRHQLRVAHPSLPRAFFWTFDDYDRAQEYGNQLLATLALGLMPAELLEQHTHGKAGEPLTKLVDTYVEKNTAISRADRDLARVVKPLILGRHTRELNFELAQALVKHMKLTKRYAPGTIRKRIDYLGRVIDYHIVSAGNGMSNPFRLMPAGYSIYNDAEARILVDQGHEVPEDVHRDRRLDADEEARIRRAFTGEKMNGRERGFPHDPELEFMFSLVQNTGLRLREAFTLPKSALTRTPKGTLFIDLERGSKGHRGILKPRQIPITPPLRDSILAWVARPAPKKEKRMFPGLWDGSLLEEDLIACSGRISQRFIRVFAAAGVSDFVEHDLRHEATARYVLLRRPDGNWLYSPNDVQKVMGWKSLAMYDRYANLRGSDVVDAMAQLG